jgi:hypothetical protein
MSVEPSTWAKYRSIFLGVKFAAGSEIFKTLRDRVHEDLDYGKLSPPIQILGRGHLELSLYTNMKVNVK